MSDESVASARKPVKVKSGRLHTLTAGPDKITFRELSFMEAEGGREIIGKWIYLFEEDTGDLYAEIFAEDESSWRIEYRPRAAKAIEDFDVERQGVVVVNRTRLANAEYRVFLSPVRASKDALELLKNHLSDLEPVVSVGKNRDEIPYAYAADLFSAAESGHRFQYLPTYHDWENFVSNEERQGRLFIASVVSNWIADGDPADVEQYLRDKTGPERILEEYKKDEQVAREQAEQAMVELLGLMDSVQHTAIDMSTQAGGAEPLAVGLLHWGIVSQSMLGVAPGRVYAHKMMREGKQLPAAVIFGESENPDLPSAYSIFKKTYAASVGTMTELLAAKVRLLRESVGSPRETVEKIAIYLRNLSIETELKGTYDLIHERLETGDRITKKLKGPKRSRVIKSYQKLARKAGSEIPDYDQRATKLLDTAERLEFKQLSIEEVGQSLQFLFDLISLMSAIEEYRSAFPEAKDEKLISVVGAGGDFYQATTEVIGRYSNRAAFLRISGGAAGFVSGVIDMLDAEEKGVRAAMNNDDYAAAAGHGITAVGASMTALAGGILLVKGISGGAMFGGPFGAIVGAIGAGLMAVGMLVVSYFSDNDYQSFVRHCYLGEDSGTSITPDWATVPFGGGSLRNEVMALYDLLYRFKVKFAKTVRVTDGLPRDTYEWSGLSLTIYPPYGQGESANYSVNLELVHTSRHVSGKFVAKNLSLPDEHSSTGTSGKADTPYIARRWSSHEVVDEMRKQGDAKADSVATLKNLYIYPGEFTIEVQQTINGKPVGQTMKLKGTSGGRKKFGNIDLQEWDHVVFE